ncbi:MAG: radical SAM protein [Deltaproteobacteria bacterium]|jgi:radical SAM protein with 4Fe4S-binding SPASM domain|nr:radical SAM protein [Deltaproteobacteria bacterium]
MSDLLNRYLEKSARNHRLSSLEFEITDKCNLNCDHCYKIRSHNFIKVNLFKKAIDQAAAAGAIKIGFNGGEPLLHPDFLELANYALRKGMALTINSNGTLFTPKLFAFFKKWKGVLFQISLYGHNATSSKKITGDATAYAKTMQTINTMAKLGFTFKVALLARRDEQTHLASLYEKLSSRGIIVHFQPYISGRENGDKYPLSLNIESKTDLEKLIRLDTQPDLEEEQERKSFVETNTPSSACGAGISSLSIKSNGDIHPCIMSSLVLGNLHQSSLSEIFNSAKLKEFRRQNLLPPECKNCQYWQFCARCPIIDSFETGDPLKISSRNCQIARLRKKLNDKFKKQDR